MKVDGVFSNRVSHSVMLATISTAIVLVVWGTSRASLTNKLTGKIPYLALKSSGRS